ncbi:MAG: hypothetical protein AB1705_16545 [Verrucomicrobiota bacterium]
MKKAQVCVRSVDNTFGFTQSPAGMVAWLGVVRAVWTALRRVIRGCQRAAIIIEPAELAVVHAGRLTLLSQGRMTRVG